jgi:hypothetical protein
MSLSNINNNSNFNDVLSYSLDYFTTNLAENFKNYANNNMCEQKLEILNNTSLIIAPNAIVENCNFTVSQTTDINKDSLCVDINKQLISMSLEDRNNFINASILALKNVLLSKLNNKKNFIDYLCETIKNKMLISYSNSQTRCSQNIKVETDQKLILEGTFICDNNTRINLTNNVFVDMFMKCLVQPVYNKINNDSELARRFNTPDNNNCIYSETVISSCDNNNRKIKLNILKPLAGTGECKYVKNINEVIDIVDGMELEIPCEKVDCLVSDWSNWGKCTMGVNGKAVQKRSRRYVSIGDGCEKLNMIDYRSCNIENEPEYLQNLDIPVKSSINLLYNNKISDTRSRVIVVLILTIFLILFYKIFSN